MTVVEVFHRPGQKTFGPWGNHTSSLDWCEDNYTHSPHIAEFWNTTSNIPFMLLGIFGILSTRNLPHRTRYILAHACVVMVGFGSFVFHTTLKWHAQVLLDELPMLWSVSMCLYTTSVGAKDKGSLALKLLIAAVPITISALYLRYPNPILHQVAFAAIIFVSASQWIQLFQSLPSVTATQIQNRADCKRIFLTGAISFASGFIIWNIDNICCNQLTTFRMKHGDIVGALSQGHAWWHLLTGLGTSRLFCAMTYLTLAVQQPDAFELAYFLGLPYVRPKGDAGRHTTADRKVLVKCQT